MREPKLPKVKLNGEFYHGSVLRDNEMFTDFGGYGYSDYDATWFTSMEEAAEKFSNSALYDEKTELMIVFKVNIKTPGIAKLDYSKYINNIMEYYDLGDPREYLEILGRKGYNGWITDGSIDSLMYDDIAIIDTSCVTVVAAKIHLDGRWTDYLTVDEIRERLELE